MRMTASQRSGINKRTGNHGEDAAENVLRGLGVEQLRQIATPYKILGMKVMRGVRWYRLVFSEKVHGDRIGSYRGIIVLAEVKTIWDSNLQYSELDEHQHEALRRNDELRGISLLVWVHNSGIHVMNYAKLDFFVPRSSIKPEQAKSLNIIDLEMEFFNVKAK